MVETFHNYIGLQKKHRPAVITFFHRSPKINTKKKNIQSPNLADHHKDDGDRHFYKISQSEIFGISNKLRLGTKKKL